MKLNLSKKVLFIIVSCLYLFSSNSQAIEFFSSETNAIEINTNELSPIISSLFGAEEESLKEEVQSLIYNIKNNKPIMASESFSKFSILLKYMLPNICKDPSSIEGSSYNEVFDSFYAELSKDSKAESFLNDMDSINNNTEIKANNETLALMLFLKISCLNMNKTNEENISLKSINKHNRESNKTNEENSSLEDSHEHSEQAIIDPFSGTDMQPGTVIVNDGFNGTNSFEEKSLSQFGINSDDWKEAKKKDIKSLGKNGFIEVEKEKIPNIDEYYEKHADKLSTLDEIEKELSFYPERIETIDYKLLGVSPSGTVDEKGLASSLVRLYESPLGKILINEENLESSNAIVSLDKDFLNIDIGKSPASLVAMKSEEEDVFVTEIYWVNETRNRAYTVEVNSNLNDDSTLEKRENLLKFLSDKFENNK